MTAKKKTPKKKPIPRPTRNVKNGKPKKPASQLARNTKKYATKPRGRISIPDALYTKIAARSRVESTAAGHSISASKLVERIMIEYLDGLEGAKKLSADDEYKAAKIVVGGFVLKDRFGGGDGEGPFVHVDSKGRVTRCGFPKTPPIESANERGLRLAGETATRSRNVADGPIVQRYENSEFDPGETAEIPMPPEDAALVVGEDEVDDAAEERIERRKRDLADSVSEDEDRAAALDASEQAADEERVADDSEFGEAP